MDNRYNIKINNLSTRDRLKAFKKRENYRSMEEAINHLMDKEGIEAPKK